MADSRAYTFNINPIGSGNGEDSSVHQVAPSWVLTFVRWQNRDTLRTTTASPTSVRDPLVVENDCLQVNTVVNKGTLTPSVNATLVMTDVNYLTSIAPGDFMFVNMLNWPSEARRVANNARAKKAINGLNDGFKGVFKVQGVRRILTTDPNTGTKIVLFKINGFGFTEFNNTIYFNPYMLDSQDKQNQLLFASFIGRDWTSLINDKGLTNVQDIMAVLIQSFIGTGITDEGRQDKNGTVRTPNVHFFIPELVGSLLGIRGVKAAKDIYTFLFGIQKYASGSASTPPSLGLNPSDIRVRFPRFYYTHTPCQGDSLLKPEYWNQVKTWAILNQFSNAPLNELYTCFRVSPNNKVMPTVVFRQIPFTTEDFTGSTAITKFMNLPRWKINPSLIIDQDIGRDESARINFVQYFGRSTVGVNGADISLEIAQGNWLYDIDDVQRSGLRPYVISTQFDEPTSSSSSTDSNKLYRSPVWAKIVGNALIGGHLKLNGTITCAGLVDPIAVGDNLELDGIVYHIEQISHNCSISIMDGKRTFRTIINLSSGMSTSSSTAGTRYPEMTYTNANDLRDVDYSGNDILPGVAESQDVVYRNDPDDGKSSPNNPFPQPGGSQRKIKRRKGK